MNGLYGGILCHHLSDNCVDMYNFLLTCQVSMSTYQIISRSLCRLVRKKSSQLVFEYLGIFQHVNALNCNLLVIVLSDKSS